MQEGALALTSCDRQDWTLQRVELVSHDEAIWALSAFVLALTAILALPNNVDDVSGAAVASLLAQSALIFSSVKS